MWASIPSVEYLRYMRDLEARKKVDVSNARNLADRVIQKCKEISEKKDINGHSQKFLQDLASYLEKRKVKDDDNIQITNRALFILKIANAINENGNFLEFLSEENIKKFKGSLFGSQKLYNICRTHRLFNLEKDETNNKRDNRVQKEEGKKGKPEGNELVSIGKITSGVRS